MQKIIFSTTINAPKEKVWEILWNLDAYRKWTTAFAEGSDAKTDNWKEGSKVLFVDQSGNGMVSMVAVNKTNEYMSFKHLGEIMDGVEDTTSEKVKVWNGSMENYTLQEDNGVSTLTVDLDIADEYKEMFENMWPTALKNVKELAEGTTRVPITITAAINAPVEKVWNSWTAPAHITQWCQASDDWHAPYADNDVRVGGTFKTTMAAKDGSMSFDFWGVYTEVTTNRSMSYTMEDGRKATILFEENNGKTIVTETFDAENQNSLDMQRDGWQAILNNFKKHTESI